MCGAADVRHQRPVGRLLRRGLEDDHPGLGGGEVQLAPRAGPGLPRDRAAHRPPRAGDRAADGDGRGEDHPRRRAGDHAARPSGREARLGRRSRTRSARRRSSIAPADRCRSSRRSTRSSACKSVLIGFASPNGNFHAPNEWMPLCERARRDGGDRAPLGALRKRDAGAAARLRPRPGRIHGRRADRARTTRGCRSARRRASSASAPTRCAAGRTAARSRATRRPAAIAASCGRASRR